MGVSVRQLLYNIESLVVTHLENDVGFQIPVPEALQWAPDFEHAVADCIVHLRTGDDLVESILNDSKAQHECKEKYTRPVQSEYRRCARKVLGPVFKSWTPSRTQGFNKGFHGVLKMVSGRGINWEKLRCKLMMEAGRGN
ncbi:uncharacterized protein EKO05_0011483 [Ascochyta rabiei]|uniref:Uncharacterized protein n=1 Tax=Didymella rabiei TaxID=5454 RepID=A0A163ANM7_DIDRA|nr:uncharacterized protein EKO05_0011483 [Ascochyta rabiei]KZM21291.1 hypothetical protein ST47_g7556 [Ascochyta rabiei]UPX21293.1 hypothetical protein EKO05_0011483 [Ascochyta rabiei]